MTKTIEKYSEITCPACQHQKVEMMQEDSCQYFYECENCHTILKPEEGDCCVFCSYGTQPCPPIQMSKEREIHFEKFDKYIKWAFVLSMITIFYNIAEGIVSTMFGATDETLALFGFGVDSFVEVISGVGIAHMIWRMRHNPIDQRDRFEVTALKVTGTAFYLLTGGLVIGSALSLIFNSQPDSTVSGIIIAALSILTMYFLYKAKMKVGIQLNSEPIISDAKCTKTCFYLSFILLGSSLLYALLAIPYVDVLGSLGIAWYAFKEGKEAFEKSERKSFTCGDCCS